MYRTQKLSAISGTCCRYLMWGYIETGQRCAPHCGCAGDCPFDLGGSIEYRKALDAQMEVVVEPLYCLPTFDLLYSGTYMEPADC